MKLMKRIWRILTPEQKRIFVVLFFMMLIGAGLETMGTGLILPLIEVAMTPESVEGSGTMGKLYKLSGADSPTHFLIMLVIVLIIVYVVKDVYLYFMYYAQYKFVTDGQYNTSRVLFREYVNRPYEFYLNASTPIVIRSIVSDVNGVYNLIRTMLELFTDVIIFAALFVLSMSTNVIMTLIMTVILAFILLINKKVFGPILHDYGVDVQKENANVTKWLLQAMDGMKETKMLNKEGYFVGRYEQSSKRLAHISLMQQAVGNVPRYSIETVIIVAILAMVGVFLGNGTNSTQLIGQVAVLAMVAIRIMPTANRIVNAFNSIDYYRPTLDSVEDTIVHAHEIKAEQLFIDYSKSVEKMPFHDVIRLENITYRYPKTDVDILKDSSLDIHIGRSIGFVGPSGAGKSTTVDILLGLLTPTSGKVTVDGQDIQGHLHNWHANVGYVPQMMFMLDDSIRRNVAYGVADEEIDDERVWHALKEAQIDTYVRSLPEGLDASIGERGIRISGGQRQRIGIARALYNDPEVMVFDEATSALDNDTEKAIMQAIEALHGKKTLIIVAHRLTTIEKCDEVYRVEGQTFHRER